MNARKGLSRKEFLELSNSPTLFCWLYIFLASGQILLKSAKSLLSCNSWKCPLQAKIKIWENSAWKKSLATQTSTAPLTPLWKISQSFCKLLFLPVTSCLATQTSTAPLTPLWKISQSFCKLLFLPVTSCTCENWFSRSLARTRVPE